MIFCGILRGKKKRGIIILSITMASPKGNYSIQVPYNFHEGIFPTTKLQFWMRVTQSGIISPIAFIVNLVTLVAIMKGHLNKKITYIFIADLCLAQGLIALIESCLVLPGVVAGR